MPLTIADIEHGIVLPLDKPYGWTSFDAIRYVQRGIRQRFGMKPKIGHAGTLDPLATGALLLCIGAATRQIAQLQNSIKEYRATLCIGAITPSYDIETEPCEPRSYSHIQLSDVERVLSQFVGELNQVPPQYSAKNVDGQRAYNLARAGSSADLKSTTIFIHTLDVLCFEPPYITISVSCSKGTYIRALARDIGDALGCGAYLTALRRTACAAYTEPSLRSVDAVF